MERAFLSCLGTRRRARPGRVTDYPAPGSRQKAKRKDLGEREREREPWEGESWAGEWKRRRRVGSLPERERREIDPCGFPESKKKCK